MPSLNDRLQFQSRGLDDNGDPLGEFEGRFALWASLDYQRGSESAVSNRLEGKQPAAATIRDSAQARQITDAWRAVVILPKSREGETFNITSVAPSRDAGFLDLMGISGVATG